MIRHFASVACIVGLVFLTNVSPAQSTDGLQLAKSPKGVRVPPPAASSTSGESSKLPPPEINLIDAGDEPRQALRYSFKKGTSWTVSADQTARMQMHAAGRELPLMPAFTATTVFRSNITNVTSDVASIERKILSVDVDSQGSDESKAKLKKKLNGLKSFRTVVHSDKRGIAQRVEADTSGIEDPEVRKLLESMKEAMGRTIIPTPVEAIGVGGKWKAISSLDQLGLVLSQRAIYTISKLTERDMDLDVQMDLSAPPGKIALPGAAGGIPVELVELSGKGSGKCHVKFSGYASEYSLDSEVVVKMKTPALPGQGQGLTLEVNMSINLAMKSLE